MQLIPVWSVKLSNPFINSLSPILASNSSFYISDGWGSTFPSMRLRQINLLTGEEIQNILIRNSIRCVYIREKYDDIFAISDNKIFHIEKSDLNLCETFTKGILKYGDYINSNDMDTLLIMNGRGESLFIYNFIEQKGVKKRIKGCKGILKESEDTFLIFSPYQEKICRYSISSNTITSLKNIGMFHSVSTNQQGSIILQMGEFIEEEKHSTHAVASRIEPLPIIHYYPNLAEEIPHIINFDFPFNKVICHNYTLYLINNNIIYRVSLISREVIDKYEFEKDVRILSVFPETNNILTYKYTESDTLSCWLLN